MSIDSIELSKILVRCPSITPKDKGALDAVQKALESIGFKCHRLLFSEEGYDTVDNLYARLGDKSPNLCFAGHTDVVPIGDLTLWDIDPFSADIINNTLYGRGAVDMKPAIAAWIAAVSNFVGQNNSFKGSISLIITGDEEGIAINGTRKILKWLEDKGEKLDACIVGEPTNPEKLGEMIKIGRRGSINFFLTVNGIQGHAAYPNIAENPVSTIIEILHGLKNFKLDEGTQFFQPSNLEVTSIDVNNPSTNIIPAKAKATFNIRFNNKHTSQSLEKWVTKQCELITGNYTLETQKIGESFITKPGPLSGIVAQAIEDVTGENSELSTSGGTSDARFIKDYCPVIEFGLINKTAHKVNEHIAVKDIKDLEKIYEKVINLYFSA